RSSILTNRPNLLAALSNKSSAAMSRGSKCSASSRSSRKSAATCRKSWLVGELAVRRLTAPFHRLEVGAEAFEDQLHILFVIPLRLGLVLVELGRAERRVGADQVVAAGPELIGRERVLGVEDVRPRGAEQRHIDPRQRHHQRRRI